MEMFCLLSGRGFSSQHREAEVSSLWGGGKERFLLGIDLILVHNIQPFLRKYSCDIYHNTIKSLPHKRWMPQEEGEYFGKKILKNRKKSNIG